MGSNLNPIVCYRVKGSDEMASGQGSAFGAAASDDFTHVPLVRLQR